MFFKCVLAYLIRLIRKPCKAWRVSAWVPDLLSNACLFRRDTVLGGKKQRNTKVKRSGAACGAVPRSGHAAAARTCREAWHRAAALLLLPAMCSDEKGN